MLEEVNGGVLSEGLPRSVGPRELARATALGAFEEKGIEAARGEGMDWMTFKEWSEEAASASATKTLTCCGAWRPW